MIRETDPGKYKPPRIKICGLTDIRETEYLNEAKADYAGFVFYPPSKRHVTIDQARKIAEGLDKKIKRVAVLVSPEVSDIEALQDAGFIDIIQIHRDLSVAVLEATGLPIWRALNISSVSGSTGRDHLIGSAISHLPDEHRHKIEAVLVDAPDFGSGRTFDWGSAGRPRQAETIDTAPLNGEGADPGKVSFILAGGLNAGNVAEGIRIFKPDIVDVSSGVEGKHGKDKVRIDEFVNAVRNSAADGR